MTALSRFGPARPSLDQPASGAPNVPPCATSSTTKLLQTPRVACEADPARANLIARRRAIRVWALTIAIAAMSLGDLSMTLTHLRAVGMGEGNPIARYVIGFNSPALLATWKCATVALACAIFLWARHRRSAEVACWACAGVLAALTVGWIHYANEASKLTPTLDHVAQSEGALWVTMTQREADTP